MNIFPGRWLDFTSQKELKRLRKDISNTLSLKLQIALSVGVAIISFLLAEYITNCNMWIQIAFCVGLLVVVVLIFLFPLIIDHFRLRMRCNVLIKGKDAVSIFDDEIVYNVLVACEYYNAIISVPNTELREELISFYKIEIAYYVTKAINQLHTMQTNSGAIFGDSDGKIAYNRARNIVEMIDVLTQNGDIELKDMDKTDLDNIKLFFNVPDKSKNDVAT